LITYYHFNKLDSTNNYAESLIKDKRPTTPYVITTDYQTEGQGTKQRKWYAEKNKSLLYTLVFFSKNPTINTEIIVLTAAKSVQTLLENHYQIATKIQKPNDIYLNHKKIGGILIKNIIQGKKCWTLIGIGLNINTSYFPEEIKNKATSIYQETKKEIIIRELDKPLTHHLLQSYSSIM